MKRLMYIYPYDNDELTDKLKSETNVAYSEDASAFICYEDVFESLNSQYGLSSLDDNGGRIASTSLLMDALDCEWDCQECIVLRSVFDENEKIEHNLGGDAEIVLQIYEDDSYEKWEEKSKELLLSDDWYKKLYKEIRITMLDTILVSIRQDVESQIKAIEAE